jgi:hypothetical protein
LLDPDGVLKAKLVEFVGRGDFGLASSPKTDGTYERLWHAQAVPPEEVAFESGVLLLKKAKANELKKKPAPAVDEPTPPADGAPPSVDLTPIGPAGGGIIAGGMGVSPPIVVAHAGPSTKTIRLSGSVPPELWNRLGTRVLPKLKAGKNLKIGIDFSVTVEASKADDL